MTKKFICSILIISLVFIPVNFKTVSATRVEIENEIITTESTGRYHRDMTTGEVTYTTIDPAELAEAAEKMGYADAVPCELPNTEIANISNKEEAYSTNSAKGTLSIVNPATGGQYRNSVNLIINKNGGTYIGSGFMIGANTVATCGHCLYSYISSAGSYVWADSIQVIPARADNSYPYGSAWATEIIVPEEWTDDHNTNFDWGIIRLDSNLNVGKLGLRTQLSSYNKTYVMGNGYPGEIKGKANFYMYRYDGQISKSSTYILTSDAIPTPKEGNGMSGGPVYFYSSSTGYTAISLIRAGNTSGVYSVRITQSLYNEFLSYRNLTA